MARAGGGESSAAVPAGAEKGLALPPPPSGHALSRVLLGWSPTGFLSPFSALNRFCVNFPPLLRALR